MIEFCGLDGDDGVAVVPVQVAALSFVVEKAMAVAEVDFASDAEHGKSRSQESGDGETTLATRHPIAKTAQIAVNQEISRVLGWLIDS